MGKREREDNSMPKFCTKCGSALINGKCPNCDSDQPMGQQDHQTNNVSNHQEYETHAAKDYKEEGKAFFHNLLIIIKNPVDGFLVAAEDRDSKIGLIFMGMEAVLAGLFVFIFFSRIQGMIELLSGMSSSDLSGNLVSFFFLIAGCLLNMGENMEAFGSLFTNGNELTRPFMGGYFVREAIIVFLTSLIISGLVYVLMRYMAHADMNWFQSCQLVGLRSLGACMGWLTAIIAVLLGLYTVAIIAIMLGMVLSMIYLGVSMAVYPGTKRNLVPYILFILAVIMSILAYVVMKGNLETLVGSNIFRGL